MRIESHHAPAPRINSLQERGPELREETVQVPVEEPIELNPALKAFLGESDFDPAVEKAQAKEAAPAVDPSLYGGWAGERIQLGKLIAEMLKTS
ncbi:MAG TPA: hypothetical protein VNA24_28420 [Hyalangium sp.]|nr:hypothetical protein [Hyalangium sp.]